VQVILKASFCQQAKGLAHTSPGRQPWVTGVLFSRRHRPAS
jgi:hypothetical protein